MSFGFSLMQLQASPLLPSKLLSSAAECLLLGKLNKLSSQLSILAVTPLLWQLALSSLFQSDVRATALILLSLALLLLLLPGGTAEA